MQCSSRVHKASVASAARSARIGSARSGPRPQRERAQRHASALHTQPHLAKSGAGLASRSTAGAEGTAASRSCSALPECIKRVSPARRVARASEAHVLCLAPRESERRDTRARYTRNPTSRSQGQGWQVGARLAPKERRRLARAVLFQSA